MSKFENCTIMLPDPIYPLKGDVFQHIDRYTGYVPFEFLVTNGLSASKEQNLPVFVQQIKCTSDMSNQYLRIPCEERIWYYYHGECPVK